MKVLSIIRLHIGARLKHTKPQNQYVEADLYALSVALLITISETVSAPQGFHHFQSGCLTNYN